MNQIKLVHCYHCYAIADHKKPTCPYINELQRCPRCAQTGHKSWQCQNQMFCMHCAGPHRVTSPCCPWYQEKMESIKIKLINELSTNFNKPQEVPTFSDAMNILITSAYMANGSLMTFITNLFSTSQALAQSSTPLRPYVPYTPLSLYNQDMEFSSSPSINISENSVQIPTYDSSIYSEESLAEPLPSPQSLYPEYHPGSPTPAIANPGSIPLSSASTEFHPYVDNYPSSLHSQDTPCPDTIDISAEPPPHPQIMTDAAPAAAATTITTIPKTTSTAVDTTTEIASDANIKNSDMTITDLAPTIAATTTLDTPKTSSAAVDTTTEIVLEEIINETQSEPDTDTRVTLVRIDYNPINILDNFRKSCRLKIMKQIRNVFPRAKPYFTRTGKTITIDVPQSTVNLADQITALADMKVSHKVYSFPTSTQPLNSPK